MVVVEEQWALLNTTNGGGVCGAVRATMVVQFTTSAMVLDQLVVVLVVQRASGCGGSLSWSYMVLLLELRWCNRYYAAGTS
jgi:hypothetical protein